MLDVKASSPALHSNDNASYDKADVCLSGNVTPDAVADDEIYAEDIPADKDSEYYEFKLSRSDDLRCSRPCEPHGTSETDLVTSLSACGECEACRLHFKARDVKQWFWRCGHATQHRFLSGLVQRFHSVDLLRYVVHLTAGAAERAKDRTYARSRTMPGLRTDRAQCADSGDRALDPGHVELLVRDAWIWFTACSYWTKCNFVLGVMRQCDAELLALVSRQAQSLLVVETQAARHREMLNTSRASFAITERTQSELTDLHLSSATIEDCPELVLPASAKAYSGLSRYKDFIRELPVHLSKYILGMLDEATLFNCESVSLSWHYLVEETKQEFFTNQQMWEDIMLMQGSSGVNAAYANDLSVLVPNVDGETGEAIPTSEAVVEARFKSEISMANAYSGISTRKVIIEERNVYCGSYNVLVLTTELHEQRAMHTSGGKYVAVDWHDRRIHLIEIATAGESCPPIAGHSGPIRSIHMNESEGFLLSGSYDTSIRKWTLENRKCTRIFNGHQDTVIALDYCSKSQQFASASLDCSAKVWSINSGKCLRTFKHRHPVMCAAISEALCITGCQAGRVKVWDLATGKLIKLLKGHKGEITAIKFDKWHIITASKDGYALAWSSQGKHDKCVMALRHPCEVTSAQFVYLRVITGAQDGRVRIWNVITGQCCRIMRGNSQSDPILSLTAVDDCLTVNTKTNVLMLSFEAIEWDYTLETDKVSSLVPRNKFAKSPLKVHSYAYTRAHWTAQNGCADRRLILKGQALSRLGSARSRKSGQSRRSISKAKQEREVGTDTTGTMLLVQAPALFNANSVPQPTFAPSEVTTSFVADGVPSQKRRVSWAFQRPDVLSCGEPSLEEVKLLLKKQIRSDVPSPDYVYMSVAAVHARNAVHDHEAGTKADTDATQTLANENSKMLRNRPRSCPSKLDGKTKVKVSKARWRELLGSELIGLHENQDGGDRARLSAHPLAAHGCTSSSPTGFTEAKELRPEYELRVSTRSPTAIPAQRGRRLRTTATETCEVPMLMYPKKTARENEDTRRTSSVTSISPALIPYPLCSQSSMRLKTYSQEQLLVQAAASSDCNIPTLGKTLVQVERPKSSR